MPARIPSGFKREALRHPRKPHPRHDGCSSRGHGRYSTSGWFGQRHRAWSRRQRHLTRRSILVPLLNRSPGELEQEYSEPLSRRRGKDPRVPTDQFPLLGRGTQLDGTDARVHPSYESPSYNHCREYKLPSLNNTEKVLTIFTVQDFKGNCHDPNALVQDARPFLCTSRPAIEKAPLQIYSSALVFFAPYSRNMSPHGSKA